MKVEFEDITAELLRSYGYDIKDGAILPDGYYNRNTKTIHIGFSVYNPVTFVFKHELTHFGEGTVQYEKFVEAVRNSKAFKKWLKKKTGFGKIANLEDAYLLMIAKPRGYTLNENGELSEADRQELMCEVIADFVGDCIFDSDTSMLNRMMSELDENERNVVFKHIQDFFSYLLRKLQGEKQLTFEIVQLEKEFNKMLNEAVQTKKETPTENSGDLQFSYINESKDTSIKQQLNENSNLLNSMDIVASLDENKTFESKQQVVIWVLKQFERTGYKVNRRGFGEVVLDKKRINKGLTYLKTNEERLAFALVLLECGFMDSCSDVPIILTDSFAEQVATACVEVIVAKAGITKKVEVIVAKAGITKKVDVPENNVGNKDNKVLEWQKAAIADGFKFSKYGADGKWGAECEAVAKQAICKKRDTYKYQNLTKIVQSVVGVTADGKFGNNTKAAVIKFQKLVGLNADGIVGLNTWKKILGVK